MGKAKTSIRICWSVLARLMDYIDQVMFYDCSLWVYSHLPCEMRKCFYDELQDTLNDITTTDLLFLLRDFNAHTGVRDQSSVL